MDNKTTKDSEVGMGREETQSAERIESQPETETSEESKYEQTEANDSVSPAETPEQTNSPNARYDATDNTSKALDVTVSSEDDENLNSSDEQLAKREGLSTLKADKLGTGQRHDEKEMDSMLLPMTTSQIQNAVIDIDDEIEDEDEEMEEEDLNDGDDEEDDYDAQDVARDSDTSPAHSLISPHESLAGSKDDDDDPVLIESSDEEEQTKKVTRNLEDVKYHINRQIIYDDDSDEYLDDDDDYDEDDLMDAVVTSPTKALSSRDLISFPRKRPPSKRFHKYDNDNRSRLRLGKAKYCSIAKRKILRWLQNKRKREAYKTILPKYMPSTLSAAAMRRDQPGGLLHLKIPPPSVSKVGQKSIFLSSSSVSTPIISKVESHVSTPKTLKNLSLDQVIDLDSAPEDNPEKLSPRIKKSSTEKYEIDIRPPPAEQRYKETVDEKTHTPKMQPTDKVRDTIQKSSEQEVEEVESIKRLSYEQNKENLHSNETVKKEKDETSPKEDLILNDYVSAATNMDVTTESAEETTLKASDGLIISDVCSIKSEVLNTPRQPAADISLSKSNIPEDLEAKVNTPQQLTLVGASKRRRSSSTQEKSKIHKPTTEGSPTEQGDDEEEYIHPTKKLREELMSNYPTHDRILNEYIEKTSNESIDSLQRHIEQILSEIQNLNEMIKTKEVEWNNMLHQKKIKEEICFRLTRRKQVMEIMATKVGETGNPTTLDDEYSINESILSLSKALSAQQKQGSSSTPLPASSLNSATNNPPNFSPTNKPSSGSIPTTAQLIIQNRANMKSSDLAKEKANTQRLHRILVSRNILPKPSAPPAAGANHSNQSGSSSANGPTVSNSNNQPILNSYLTSAESVQQLVDMMNGHHSSHSGLVNGNVAAGVNNSQAAMVGRQGPFKDVRSIIADFRQQHPEVVPRRGRRNSRPSSNDSSSHSLSNANQITTNHPGVNSFKDVLAPFTKSQSATSLRSSTSGHQQNPPYPEVTLHPVTASINNSSGQDQPTGSLLHGILTKFSRPNESANVKLVPNQASANYISNFSPTLARLLTAPERISSGNQVLSNSVATGDGTNSSTSNAHQSIPGFGVNLSKMVGHNSEITITPVMNSMHQQTLLQQQLQHQLSRAAAAAGGNNGTKDEHFLKLSSFANASTGNDDDADDSVDRLVIDEGVDSMIGGEEHQRIAPHALGQEFNENEVPVCQGCKKHEAQFVCAGCGNQWYCSRECQVTAWDDHSEVCTATKQIRNKFYMLKSKDLLREDEYFIVRRRKGNKFYPQFH